MFRRNRIEEQVHALGNESQERDQALSDRVVALEGMVQTMSQTIQMLHKIVALQRDQLQDQSKDVHHAREDVRDLRKTLDAFLFGAPQAQPTDNQVRGIDKLLPMAMDEPESEAAKQEKEDGRQLLKAWNALYGPVWPVYEPAESDENEN